MWRVGVWFINTVGLPKATTCATTGRQATSVSEARRHKVWLDNETAVGSLICKQHRLRIRIEAETIGDKRS